MCLTVENANKIYMKIIENEFILVLYAVSMETSEIINKGDFKLFISKKND